MMLKMMSMMMINTMVINNRGVGDSDDVDGVGAGGDEGFGDDTKEYSHERCRSRSPLQPPITSLLRFSFLNMHVFFLAELSFLALTSLFFFFVDNGLVLTVSGDWWFWCSLHAAVVIFRKSIGKIFFAQKHHQHSERGS